VHELVIASGNNNKVNEIQCLLGEVPFRVSSLNMYPQIPEIQETGNTYRENALLKAVQVAKLTNCFALGDDSGLEVEALGDQPGLYSARFAGEGVSYRENNKKLLSLLEGVPASKRQATFYCVMALADPKGKTYVLEGSVKGLIAMKEQGTGGFGYDPLFILPDLGKTFAELSPDEKNSLSHRAKALEKVKEILIKLQ